MRKYRIKETKKKNGQREYTPQYLLWKIFWCDFHRQVHPDRSFSILTNDLETAKDIIEKDKEARKNKKGEKPQTVKYHYVT